MDFNLYIPSNAMLLAWIAGIAATSLHSAWSHPSTRRVVVQAFSLPPQR